MQIKILGAGGNIGNSGILVKEDSTAVLLDYGLNPGKNITHPLHVRPRDIKALISTHAHLDHIGYEPYLYIDGNVPNYATPVTIELSELLLMDLLNISGDKLPFTAKEVAKLKKMSRAVGYNETFKINDLKAELLNAGHIPGSAMVYLEGEKRVLYTGDINHIPTRLLEPAGYDLPEVDYIISECTYAMQDHPERNDEEKRLIEFSNEIIEEEGTVLVPSFAVGRAQELAEIYYSHEFKHDVYMDGMALTVNDILLRYPEYVRDPDFLRSTLDYVKYVSGWEDRRKIVKEPVAIISPAGMLVGGAAIFYSKKISKDKRNGIAIVAYQVEGTPGRALVDEGVLSLNGSKYSVKARVGRFDLSSHSGRTQLLRMFKSLKGSPKIILVHGEREGCEAFALELNSMGLDSICAKTGDVIE
ncbi:MAG: MBL fold metallo-hydrolase [Nitrososphaeria archaeon]